MIGANPPGNFVWDAKTTDEQIQRYSELCAKDETCSKRTDDLAASMRRTAADIPDRCPVPADQGGQRPGRLLLRSHGVDLGGGAALRPDDAGLMALGG